MVTWNNAPEVRISLLEFDKADPAYLLCLPESERWRVVPKRNLFQAPQVLLAQV